MNIIRSFPNFCNNWSFGLKVQRDRTIGDLIVDKRIIEQEHVFADCSGYTRVALQDSKFIFQVPKAYFAPKFSSPEFFKKWEKEMEGMGGNVKYLGDYPYLGVSLGKNPVTCYNQKALLIGQTLVNFPMEFFMRENVWSTWELDASEYNNMLRTYHSFCLFRYLWSWHYMKIVDVYLDIKNRLIKTKPEPIEILQLAWYCFDTSEIEVRGLKSISSFYGAYGHLNISTELTYRIEKWAYLKPLIYQHTFINLIFTQTAALSSVKEIRDLINQRKYKAAYDRLKA